MISVQLFLLVLACVLLALAALKTPEPIRISFGWMGVFLLAVLSYFR